MDRAIRLNHLSVKSALIFSTRDCLLGFFPPDNYMNRCSVQNENLIISYRNEGKEERKKQKKTTLIRIDIKIEREKERRQKRVRKKTVGCIR